VSLSWLARRLGVSAWEVRKMIGRMSVRATALEPEELAIRAADKCLRRAKVDARDVGAILWANTTRCRSSFQAALRVQEGLGANDAIVMDLGKNCTEPVTAIHVARALLRMTPTLRNALIVSGDTWASHTPDRVIAPLLKDELPVSIFSDAGGAILVGLNERRRVIRGIGFASTPALWPTQITRIEKQGRRSFERYYSRGRDRRWKGEVLHQARSDRLALQRAVSEAALQLDDIDHVLCPLVNPAYQLAAIKMFDLPLERLRSVPTVAFRESAALLGLELPTRMQKTMFAGSRRIVPTHSGCADVALLLEHLEASGIGRPGEHALIPSSTLGLSRMLVVRL
jgi:3-oxoacyl-[acyl-carrier-protein] synthase III